MGLLNPLHSSLQAARLVVAERSGLEARLAEAEARAAQPTSDAAAGISALHQAVCVWLESPPAFNAVALPISRSALLQ